MSDGGWAPCKQCTIKHCKTDFQACSLLPPDVVSKWAKSMTYAHCTTCGKKETQKNQAQEEHELDTVTAAQEARMQRKIQKTLGPELKAEKKMQKALNPVAKQMASDFSKVAGALEKTLKPVVNVMQKDMKAAEKEMKPLAIHISQQLKPLEPTDTVKSAEMKSRVPSLKKGQEPVGVQPLSSNGKEPVGVEPPSLLKGQEPVGVQDKELHQHLPHKPPASQKPSSKPAAPKVAPATPVVKHAATAAKNAASHVVGSALQLFDSY